MKWEVLGSGTYNTAYKNSDSSSVLKIQLNERDDTDTPERSVRIWNEINPNLSSASICESPFGRGWVCPFIKGTQASDKETSIALIDIYNRTGRIVVDAVSNRNFLKTYAPNSQIVCVDIGMALQLEKREQESLRKSIISLEVWQDMYRSYDSYFRNHSKSFPETVNTIKALIFIKTNRPDIINVDFLTTYPKLISKLALAYDEKEKCKTLDELNKLSPEDAHNSFKSNEEEIIHIQDRIVEEKNINNLEEHNPEKHNLDAHNLEEHNLEEHNPDAHNPEERSPGVRVPTPLEIEKANEILINECPINLENIKESCIKELKRYIDSRGSINDNDIFKPSFRTRLFRNKALTTTKVESTKQLMDHINKADSIEDLYNLITESQNNSELIKTKFTSGFESSLGKCMLMVEVIKNDLVHLNDPELEGFILV